MIGDNLTTDILGANRVGMQNIWINHHGQEVADIHPTYQVTTLKDILPIINKLS